MPQIYREKRSKVNVDQSLKTSFPILRYLAAGQDADTFAEGELVGRKVSAGARRVFCEKISAGNEVAQAKNAVMRLNATSNDTAESGAITAIEGLYYVTTEMYVTGGSYSADDYVTVRYSASHGGGVFGPVDAGNTTHVLGRVILPPADSSKNTPMQIKVFPEPMEIN